MSMPKPDTTHWIAVTDNRWARLIRFQPTEAGRWHAEEVQVIRSDWEPHQDRHEKAEPTQTLANTPEHARHGHSWGHKKEEETKRFAKVVAAWLDERASDLRIAKLDVFAPDHFLGPLRKSWPKKLATLITEHDLDLTHLKPSEFLENPTVASILAADSVGV